MQNFNNFFNMLLFLPLVTCLIDLHAFAQPIEKQQSLNVTAVQYIHFGTFYLIGITGGTITVGFD